jgi:transcriptional regulator with XRE-family HTH domain
MKTIYNKSYFEFTKWLKRERKNKNLTMRQLAEKLGVHHPVIWSIENCERRLDIVEYINYCEVLNIDPIIGIDIIKQSHLNNVK